MVLRDGRLMKHVSYAEVCLFISLLFFSFFFGFDAVVFLGDGDGDF